MSQAHIPLRGVRVHNLRGIDVDIPLGKLTAICGVSGAGKSSLVFDTLHAEAQRRYLQSFSTSIRQYLEQFDRPAADRIGELPPAIAVGHTESKPGPRTRVSNLTDLASPLRVLWAEEGTQHCVRCGTPVLTRGPREAFDFVQSLPGGMRVGVGFPSASPSVEEAQSWLESLREEGFIRIKVGQDILRLDQPDVPSHVSSATVLLDRFEIGRIAPERLRESLELAFQRGQGELVVTGDEQDWIFERHLRCATCHTLYDPIETGLFDPNHPRGACADCEGLGRLRDRPVCSRCHGTGLNDQARNVFLQDWSFAQLLGASLRAVQDLLRTRRLAIHPEMHPALAEALDRLDHLKRMKLGYLSLQRHGATLSAAERRRIQVASALSSSLVEALYLLDQPASGLHARDIPALLEELRSLRDAGNTVVLVEHDRSAIRGTDYTIDLGPGAGEEGGTVVYQGPPGGLIEDVASVTGAYLSGKRHVAAPGRRRERKYGAVHLRGARTHNLGNLDVEFPLGVLCVVTGVSGAGKTSLVRHTLYPALCAVKKQKVVLETEPVYRAVTGVGQVKEVLLIDQEPIPRSARSNPATYLKVFDEIRDLFAETVDARIRNLGSGAFSFNQPGGRCEACAGQGTQSVDMQFLADVAVTCPECQGTRYQREVLNIKVRNLNIAEVLDLTIREAFRFFRAQKSIERKLKYLLDVGLDYLRLGQPTATLSGGEAQRLKLAGQLASSRRASCLFLLMEPATGLHPADVTRLLDCFDQLIDIGHSLIVVEYNLDVIRSADHLIDLGPEGGEHGGRIVAQGTPEQVALVEASATGHMLRLNPV